VHPVNWNRRTPEFYDLIESIEGIRSKMPQTPHIEKRFTSSETVRDIVIGMSNQVRSETTFCSLVPSIQALLYRHSSRTEMKILFSEGGPVEVSITPSTPT
jgi:hypothetical protein